VKVFLAGEGPNELGSRAYPPPHDRLEKRPGVLEALLQRVQPDGWEVGGARVWKKIRKLRAGGARHADTHNVLGAVLDAKEAGCDVLVFSRDQDKDEERAEAIREGIERAPQEIRGAPPIVGGVAIPLLEGWILALLGQRGTEALSPKAAQAALVARGCGVKDGAAMVDIVRDADLAALPDDAASLQAWLDRANEVLPPLVTA
jgi:hypothetical protein